MTFHDIYGIFADNLVDVQVISQKIGEYRHLHAKYLNFVLIRFMCKLTFAHICLSEKGGSLNSKSQNP